jgi:hypothetical protein
VNARRSQWHRVLETEMARWSGMTAGELVEALREPQNYEIEFEGKIFQVEIQLLENTDRYVHVALAVDDGVLPFAIAPASDSFICPKDRNP